MSDKTRAASASGEPGPVRTYVLVIVVEALTIAALYALGRAFS